MGEQATVSHQIGKHVQIFACIALSSGMLMKHRYTNYECYIKDTSQ